MHGYKEREINDTRTNQTDDDYRSRQRRLETLSQAEGEVMTTYTCKSCGTIDEHCVVSGKGPHAYEIKCCECDKHIKWASKLDIENINIEQIATEIKAAEWAALTAAKQGNFGEFMAQTNKIDKYMEKL